MAEVRPGSVQTRCSCTPRGTRVRRVCAADSPAVTRARHFARYASSAGRCSLRAKASIANDDLSRRNDRDRIPSPMSIIPERAIEHRDCRLVAVIPLAVGVVIVTSRAIALSRSLLCACARRHDIIASYIISAVFAPHGVVHPLLPDDIARYFVNYFVNRTSERLISRFSDSYDSFLPANRFSYQSVYLFIYFLSSNERRAILSQSSSNYVLFVRARVTAG